MYSVAQMASVNELQNLILAAMHCVKCTNPTCLRQCQLHADLRRALESFVTKPRNWWTQDHEHAELCADQAIQESFA